MSSLPSQSIVLGTTRCGMPASHSARTLPPSVTTFVFATFLSASRPALASTPPSGCVPKVLRLRMASAASSSSKSAVRTKRPLKLARPDEPSIEMRPRYPSPSSTCSNRRPPRSKLPGPLRHRLPLRSAGMVPSISPISYSYSPATDVYAISHPARISSFQTSSEGGVATQGGTAIADGVSTAFGEVRRPPRACRPARCGGTNVAQVWLISHRQSTRALAGACKPIAIFVVNAKSVCWGGGIESGLPRSAEIDR
eukprot:scaffold81105_cov55-Phaeocystis_antarctica.AAC.2